MEFGITILNSSKYRTLKYWITYFRILVLPRKNKKIFLYLFFIWQSAHELTIKSNTFPYAKIKQGWSK